MVNRSKKEYLQAILPRYRRVGRKYKSKILDEFCEVCGYDRKHAIKLLNKRAFKGKRKPGPKSLYGDDVRKVLKRIWLASNRMCGKRLKAAIPLWLPYYEQKYTLSSETKVSLDKISPATIDRLLKPTRKHYGSRGLSGTKPGSILKIQIPVKTHQWDVSKPGFFEADTVAHCGNSLDGSFVWSLTFTDIFSGWTENRAVWNKGSNGVIFQIKDIENRLPFPVLGFHSDNGSEFLNHHLWRYFADRESPVRFTRTRPYKKNDNAHVEQKNWTHVRLLLGYQRIEREDLIVKINQLYNTWSLFQNYFCPTLKISEKKRINSKYVKKYEQPQTPHQRLMQSEDITELQKTCLCEVFCNLDPFKLKKQIEYKQKIIFNQLRCAQL